MQILKIALGIFLVVFWFVWFLISRKRKAQEKRFNELVEARKIRKQIEAIDRKNLKKHRELSGSNLSKFRSNDHVLYNEKIQEEHYNLPLDDFEEHLIANSVVTDFQIRDWQFFLKRKLTYRELRILELTSTHGLPIEQNHFI